MRSSVAVRCTAAVLLALYAALVYRLTLMPADTEGRFFGLLDRAMVKLSHGHVQWAQTEVLANVALFVPVGLLIAAATGRWWAGAVLAVLISAGIELAQARYLPSRVPSVRDVEANGLGGLAGAIVAWPLFCRELTREDRRHEAHRGAPGADRHP